MLPLVVFSAAVFNASSVAFLLIPVILETVSIAAFFPNLSVIPFNQRDIPRRSNAPTTTPPPTAAVFAAPSEAPCSFASS